MHNEDLPVRADKMHILCRWLLDPGYNPLRLQFGSLEKKG